MPTGLSDSPDIFQDHITNLVGDIEYARAYLDNLLCLVYRIFNNYLDKLEELLQRLLIAELKVNAKSAYFVLAKLHI